MSKRADALVIRVAQPEEREELEELQRRASLANENDRPHLEAHPDLPLVVGFGISSAAHVRQVGAHADGAIVASALINQIESLPPEQRVAGAADFVRQLKIEN